MQASHAPAPEPDVTATSPEDGPGGLPAPALLVGGFAGLLFVLALVALARSMRRARRSRRRPRA